MNNGIFFCILFFLMTVSTFISSAIAEEDTIFLKCSGEAFTESGLHISIVESPIPQRQSTLELGLHVGDSGYFSFDLWGPVNGHSSMNFKQEEIFMFQGDRIHDPLIGRILLCSKELRACNPNSGVGWVRSEQSWKEMNDSYDQGDLLILRIIVDNESNGQVTFDLTCKKRDL